MAQIVKSGDLQGLLLAGQHAFKKRFSLAQFPSAKLFGPLVEKLPRSSRSWLLFRAADRSSRCAGAARHYEQDSPIQKPTPTLVRNRTFTRIIGHRAHAHKIGWAMIAGKGFPPEKGDLASLGSVWNCIASIATVGH